MLLNLFKTVLFATLLAVIAVVESQTPSGPLVSTDYGDVRGFQAVDRLNRTYDGFLGIPYATPPVGSLRWQPSQPPSPWSDVIEATEFSVHCIQVIDDFYRFIGLGRDDSEDCLYLNVYVPGGVEDALASPLPVMVFYYGGSFLIGTTEMYPCEELATTGNVLVVSVNYRVSTMGFFSTGDAVAPGNYGLWDAKTSLEWVRANVGYFGGDTSRISIFGQSAGAFLSSHLMLSPQTNRLFNRTIGISGAARLYEDTNQNTARFIAGLFNCSTESSQAMVDCLLEVDAKAIDDAYHLFKDQHEEHVDLETVVDGTFVVQDTRESWKQGVAGHLDLMNGHTHHDSAGFVLENVAAMPLNRSNGGNKDRDELYDYWYDTFSMYDNVNDILTVLYDRFPGMNDSDPATASQWASRVDTDFSFASETFYQVEKHAESGGTGSNYFYQFRYRQSFLDGYPEWVNGSHIDDLYSILGEPYFAFFRRFYLDGAEYTEEDSRLSELVMKYYANFAYTGNPNTGPHTLDLFWPEYDLATREFLLETPDPIIETHGQGQVDHYNWFLYDLWGMMRPRWGTP